MPMFTSSPTATIPQSAAPPAHSDGNPGGLSPDLLKALSRITEISSLPEITTRIIQVVEDPKSTAHDMHEIVRSDPALASKVLKVVNSAFYGLPSQISNLDRAIVMLGLSAVKNIALAASLSRLFRPGNLSAKFAVRDLWVHSIAVGVCARMVADKSFGQPEETFVAGLVHDMGLLVEYQLLPEKLRDVVTRCETQTQCFVSAERGVIGGDHTQFGAAIVSRWKFPPILKHAVQYHHDPTALQADFKKLVTAIQVADTICCQNQIGFYLTAETQEVTEEQLAIVGISPSAVAEIVEALPERIAESERIFGDA